MSSCTTIPANPEGNLFHTMKLCFDFHGSFRHDIIELRTNKPINTFFHKFFHTWNCICFGIPFSDHTPKSAEKGNWNQHRMGVKLRAGWDHHSLLWSRVCIHYIQSTPLVASLSALWWYSILGTGYLEHSSKSSNEEQKCKMMLCIGSWKNNIWIAFSGFSLHSRIPWHRVKISLGMALITTEVKSLCINSYNNNMVYITKKSWIGHIHPQITATCFWQSL